MSELLGQTVGEIPNVSGAGGMTAASRVAHAPPDGYQFVLGSVDTFGINQSLYKKPFYNAANLLLADRPRHRPGHGLDRAQGFLANDMNCSLPTPRQTTPRCSLHRAASAPRRT